MSIEKLRYPKTSAVIIEEACKGIIFVFTYGAQKQDQIIGELFALDGEANALRLRSVVSDEEDHKILTGVEIYPTLGLITYNKRVTIQCGWE